MFPPIFRGLLHNTVLSLRGQGHDEWWNNKDLEESRRGLIDITFRHYPPGQSVSRSPPWHKRGDLINQITNSRHCFRTIQFFFL